MTGRRAIVLGGGIAGVSAAIALDAAGYAVTVIERAPAPTPAGAALSIWPNAVDALASLGIADRLAVVAAPITAVALRDRMGRALMPTVPVVRALLPTRAVLQDCLIAGLGPRTERLYGRTWTEVHQDGSQVVAMLAGGTSLTADLLIDASGIWSPLADHLLDNAATYRGYDGVLALGDPAEDEDDFVATEYWGEGERFGILDIGERRRYWFYMRDAVAGCQPPDHATCAARARDFPPLVTRAVAATPPERLVPVAIHARTPPRRLGSGRIICIGDAAHAMEPNLGQGACLSIEDAAVIGSLAGRLPPDELLPAFERLRLPRIRHLMRQAASVGRLIHHPRLRDRIARRALPLVPAALHRRQVAAAQRFTLP